MARKAAEILEKYTGTYQGELGKMQFEPEREFETLIPEEQVLVSGAIDLIRLDDPPRVSLIDFKSGDVKSDNAIKLSEQEMRLQVSMYGLAAKRELEFEPDRGMVRYLDEADKKKRELAVALDGEALKEARETVVGTVRPIRDRKFEGGPVAPPRSKKNTIRCAECDFVGFCGNKVAKKYRSA